MRTATGQIPFSLVYGSEAVLPIETEIKSLRVVMEAKTLESEWARKRYNHLVSLDEKRMDTLFHTQIYQRRIARPLIRRLNLEDKGWGYGTEAVKGYSVRSKRQV